MDPATSRRGVRVLRTYFVGLLVFLYAPIAILVLFSFNDNTVLAFPLEGLTLRWYREFLLNGELLSSLRTSAIVAGLSSSLAVGLGIPAAIALARRTFRGKAVTSAVMLSPLVIPYVALGIALLVLFNLAGFELSIWTIAIGHVVISFPFTILVLLPRLQRIDRRLEEAARDLGAGGWRTFRSVTLPLLLPAVVSAFIVAFTLSFDEIVIASFIAGHEPTFPVYLFSQLRLPQRIPQVIAVASLVMLASLTIVVAAEILRWVGDRRIQAEPPGPEVA